MPDVKVITLEDRVQDIQISLTHMKTKLDYVTYYLQKIKEEGLKVRMIK
jgi:aspartokinase